MSQTEAVANPSVLLVDDENNFRQILSKRLALRGFVMREAENGLKALESMQETPSEVVVLDVKMPVMDGMETLRHLRKDFPHSEVILLTGHASTEDGVQGIKGGAFDYLTKPVAFEHLENKIRQAHAKILRIREQQQEHQFRCQMERRMVAAQRLAALGTLATGIAHEVNNPLAVINDASGWLLDLLAGVPADMPLRRELELGLGKIATSVVRARRITHQLLGHARQNEPQVALLDLGQLAQEAADLVHKEAMNHGASITIAPHESPLEARTDAGQLRQVLINLLTNAVHASGQGGQVTLELAGRETYIELRVRDNGPGIPPALLPRIFEPFFSTKPEGRGTGLGLFVSSDIVRRLGGTIEASNRPSGGALFRITIPRDYTPLPQDKEETDDEARQNSFGG